MSIALLLSPFASLWSPFWTLGQGIGWLTREGWSKCSHFADRWSFATVGKPGFRPNDGIGHPQLFVTIMGLRYAGAVEVPQVPPGITTRLAVCRRGSTGEEAPPASSWWCIKLRRHLRSVSVRHRRRCAEPSSPATMQPFAIGAGGRTASSRA
jgi:hypothetical protein